MRTSCLLLALCAVAAAQDSVLKIALDVAQRDHPALAQQSARDAVRTQVSSLAARYRMILGNDRAPPADRADAFRLLFFGGRLEPALEGTPVFQSIKELDSAEHLHIDSVLKLRKGYCLSLSVLALAVAEEVGAPLFGVAMPNHFLVRYDDGKYRHNIELTRKGVRISDEDLRKQVGRLDDDSIYLKNLTPKDIKAYLLHNRGYVALLGRKRELARSDFLAAIKLQPGLGEAHRNLGVVLGEQRKWEQAKRCFAKALSIYPNDINALINLAICRNALGDRVAAIQELEMALALDPGRARAEALLSQWRQKGPADAAPEKLPPRPPNLKPGLLGRYYAGLKFELLKTTRVDRDIDFDWQNQAPTRETPRDRFTVRWDGYLKAPQTGTYTFFLVANDGVRLWVGKQAVLDNWKNMGFRNWYGTGDLALAGGWHRIRIEHYDIFGGARILLRIGVDGRKLPLDLKKHLFHEAPPDKQPGK